MPKKKKEEVLEEPIKEPKEKKKIKDKPKFYKDYDIKWLKSEPDHPDFGLVEEYEEEFGEIE